MMYKNIFMRISLFVLVSVALFGMSSIVLAEEVQRDEIPVVYLFGRDDCEFCKEEIKFLENQNIQWEYIDVVADAYSKEQFHLITQKHGIPRVTPLTVIGGVVLQGFGGEETTGASILKAIQSQENTTYNTIEEHIAQAPVQEIVADAGCDEDGIECNTTAFGAYVFELPFVGVVDLKSVSLFSLSLLLGVIDGFNPCAMWVLITFLVLLTQAGSKKKMVFLAGVFIFAEAVMYNLILNVWYKTWNFVSLDQIVTPLVGALAMGGGIFFLYRWRKNKNVALVCDITSLDHQSKTIDKFKKIVSQPLTLATILAILVIAFSVNIIEFACSIGIPQAYTKILELNMLTFMERQWYLLVYTFGYMVDDFVVFGLAIWGFSKLEAHGHKYAQLSLLMGGVLMVILGAVLVFSPSLLVL